MLSQSAVLKKSGVILLSSHGVSMPRCSRGAQEHDVHRDTVTNRVADEKQRLKVNILVEDTLDQRLQLAAEGLYPLWESVRGLHTSSKKRYYSRQRYHGVPRVLFLGLFRPSCTRASSAVSQTFTELHLYGN